MFNTGKFAHKTIVITGASRGIGKEIALKLAQDGANIVIAAKTADPHPKLPGTIYTAAEEIEKAGGKSLPCVVDVRDEDAVQKCVEEAVRKFGGIDVLVNNASAISLTGTLETSMKRYDLMHNINTRGTFLMSQKCIPYLKQSKNPHILNLSPPLLMEPQWFANHVAYTMAKYGMSMCVLGMHEELRSDGIAVNALWPRTAIWTAAMDMLSAGGGASGSRKPEIMADAAYAILSRNSREFTGNFVMDDDILREEGVTDFTKYAMDPSAPLMMDFFVPGVEYNDFKLGGGDPKRQKSRASLKAADVAETLSRVKQSISAEHVQKIKAVFEFILKDNTGIRHVYVDLKNGNGSVGEGKPPSSDVQMETTTETFQSIFAGELSATKAFMTQKLKIKGDMAKAIQLEALLKNLQKSK
uniref:Hydroxysteroid dehydrogenase-like protein 2 n=1 Tax=Acrobeloides nanus TaxID=290746 RepID=A0A914DY31_9BILA